MGETAHLGSQLISLSFGLIALGLGLAAVVLGDWCTITTDPAAPVLPVAIPADLSDPALWTSVEVGLGLVEACFTVTNTAAAAPAETCRIIQDVLTSSTSYLDEVQILIPVSIGGSFIGLLIFVATFRICSHVPIVGNVITFLSELAGIAGIILFAINELVNVATFDQSLKTYNYPFYLACASIAASIISMAFACDALRRKRSKTADVVLA